MVRSFVLFWPQEEEADLRPRTFGSPVPLARAIVIVDPAPRKSQILCIFVSRFSGGEPARWVLVIVYQHGGAGSGRDSVRSNRSGKPAPPSSIAFPAAGGGEGSPRPPRRFWEGSSVSPAKKGE